MHQDLILERKRSICDGFRWVQQVMLASWDSWVRSASSVLKLTFVVEVWRWEVETENGGMKMLMKLAENECACNRMCWSRLNMCSKLPPAQPQVRKGRGSLQNTSARCRQINCHVLVLINYQKARSTISLSQ